MMLNIMPARISPSPTVENYLFPIMSTSIVPTLRNVGLTPSAVEEMVAQRRKGVCLR
jgi:hypothetical protein